MDFHFVYSKDEPKQKASSSGFSKILKNFIPIFALAALLPVFLFLTFTPPDLDFIPSADTKSTLRVWISPSSAVSFPNEKVTFTVMAALEDDTKIINSIQAKLTPDSQNVFVSPSNINYNRSFNGTVEIGTFEAQANFLGEFKINLPKEEIKTNLENADIETAGATLTVTNTFQ